MTKLHHGGGSSELDDARGAGAQAADAALRGLGGTAPDLVLVYASVRYDLPALLAGVRSVTGDAPLAGATSTGHFVGEHVTGPGRGVAVLVLSGGGYRFGVGSATGMADDARGTGARVARAARAAAASDLPHAALVLLSDGLGGDQQALLTGVHRAAGARVPVVGGAASDDGRLVATSVFHDGDVLRDGAVAVWVASDHPLAVGSAHGWEPVGHPQTLTDVDGASILEIGGRPAREVYDEVVELAGSAIHDVVTSGTVNAAFTFALGLVQPDGQHLVRGVYPVADGAIASFTPLPAYAAVQVMAADPEQVLSVVDEVASCLGRDHDEQVVLAFDCVARLEILGDRHHEEITRLGRAIGGATAFGFYTNGEFARSRGIGGVHNATLAALAL